MKPFLHVLAEKVFESFFSVFEELHVILPSRRACRYFREYLSKVAQKPFLAPTILSLEDFVRKLNDLQEIDKVSAILELYTTYKQFDKNPDHTLEKFAPLGTAILRDFHLIEMNLTQQKAQEMFEYLQDAKAIDRWAERLGQDEPLTQKGLLSDYFNFWTYLSQTFWAFREKMLAQKKVYYGLMYRYVYENLERLSQKNRVEKIVFAGFGPMSGVEMSIIRYFKEEKKAVFYWDADDFYVSNPIHEAGEPFRKLTKSLQLPHDENEFGLNRKQIGTFPQEITFIQTTTTSAHAKLAGTLLEEIIQTYLQKNTLDQLKKEINYVGILLPDDSQLNPLLHSLPPFEPPIATMLNITMGMPITRSSVFTLIDACFSLQESLKTSKEGRVFFYHKNLLKILAHPFLQITEQQRKTSAVLKEEIQKNNKVYISIDWIKDVLQQSITTLEPLLEAILINWEGSYQQAIAQFFSIIRALRLLFDVQEGAETIFLDEFYRLLHQLKNELATQKEEITLFTFKQFFYEVLRSISVLFTGEPIAPIQIMGMLDSRNLDFQHLIILSCNEGILPTNKRTEAIIPYDIRRKYGLPTYEDEDSMVAYTFYRLLHKTPHITCLYTDPFGNKDLGEKSRFLLQVERELKNFSSVRLLHKTLVVRSELTSLSRTPVRKDEAVMKAVVEALQQGRSPSAFIAYLKNPLDFFYDHVLKLQEEKEVEESLDQRTFGTLLHETLEELLKPYLGKTLAKEEVAILSNKELIRKKMLEALDKDDRKNELKGMSLDEGRNYVLGKVCQRLIERFFQQEEEILPIHLVMMEKTMSSEITTQVPLLGKFTFRLSGVV
ncbi:MAG: PD-(D/E)XK nuclease family protein, partial [Flammeovirgaceae bacterium]|nr:PD-(D/E)XK nuclease family protein [Flammeovirgaceae bacterium]